ncbi:MAG: hypothetical protein CMH56_14715 [Myxococcales bacterium]|nr:hypothetical protein [Myxococcales bacterium]
MSQFQIETEIVQRNAMNLKILSEDEVNAHFAGSTPQTDLKALTHLLHSQFGAYLGPNAYFQVTLKLAADAAYLKVEVMQTEDRGNIFEFFMKTAPETKSADDIPEALLDFCGHALGQHFESGMDAHLPLDYTPFLCDGQDVNAREVFRDFALEKAADAWLQKGPPSQED